MTGQAPQLVPIPDSAGRTVWPVPHEDRELLAIARPDGEIVVVDARCPHKGGPLAEGTIRDGMIVCPWHWYGFDLGSGACRTANEVNLARHSVVSRNGQLWAEVLPRRRESWSQLLRRHAAGG